MAHALPCLDDAYLATVQLEIGCTGLNWVGATSFQFEKFFPSPPQSYALSSKLHELPPEDADLRGLTIDGWSRLNYTP